MDHGDTGCLCLSERMPVVPGFRLGPGQELLRPLLVHVLLRLPLPMLLLGLSSLLTVELLLLRHLSAQVGLICCAELPPAAGTDTDDDCRICGEELRAEIDENWLRRKRGSSSPCVT